MTLSLFSASLFSVVLALSFMPAGAQDPVRDDFERHALGSNWTPASGTGIVNSSDLGTVSGTWCFARWTGSQFGADQWSEAERSADISPDMLTQVFARVRASDNARYGFHWNGDLGMSRWEIKYDGVPTAQTRILASTNAPGPLPGDLLRIEVEGQNPVVIRGYHRGRLKLIASDAELQRITGAGAPGLVSRPRNGAIVTPPLPIFESWNGGTLTWLDRGNGLAGTVGVPSLTGTGALNAGVPVTLRVLDARPSGVGVLFLGLRAINAPLLGGVLVPSPDLAVAPLLVDAAGNAAVTLPWPSGLSSGFELWSQVWILDPLGPMGAAASNGLLARVP